MSQIQDYADDINAQTNRIGDDVKAVAKKLDDAIASGDPAALASLGAAVQVLHVAADQLHQVASDPVPAPNPAARKG